MKTIRFLIIALSAIAFISCDAFDAPPTRPPAKAKKSQSPDGNEDDTPVQELIQRMRKDIAEVEARAEYPDKRIKIHHILVGKDKGEAEAAKAYKRVLDGEDFFALATEYDTSGRAGGPYVMRNHGEKAARGEYERKGMVQAFGDTGWRLKVGQVGIAASHPAKSPYGWHIIKRLE